MPEITAAVSRSEARRRKEEGKAGGVLGWRLGGPLLPEQREASRSRSGSRRRGSADEAARLAQQFAKLPEEQKPSSLSEEGKTPRQKAQEMMEREREKTRLKKLAREEEQREAALAKEEKAMTKKEKFKRY
mmetsp:Transcript_26112/g.73804  ORF Transcript_26112/g.73804 Transcript_26112/m.73804 type:complete len:131 (+) Transcript_26112:113-505(+)